MAESSTSSDSGRASAGDGVAGSVPDPGFSGDSPGPERGASIVLTMLVSVIGLIGLAYSIYSFKFLGRHHLFFLPSRVFYVGTLGLAVVPFLIAIFARRVPYLLLVLPAALCFLLYPLLNPHGVVYGQDAIFNLQFASTFLSHSVWVAGGNTTGQAVTYSFYPGSGLFNAEGSIFLGVPLTSSFPWTLPMMRFLVLFPLIFAIGNRLLGARAGVLGVLLYLSAPSLTLGDIVQQEFAIVFFALTLLTITFLIYTPASDATPLRILVLLFSSFVILSHHLTSYALGIWLAGLAVLPLLLWGRPAFTVLRASVAALRYFVLFTLFVLFFTASVVLTQLGVLEHNILLLLGNAPLSARAAAAGESYPNYQLGWIVIALGVLTLLAILTLRVALRDRPRPYLATSLLLATLIMIIAFVLFPTGFSFVAIRTTEYSLFFAAPAAAWFLLRGVMPAVRRATRNRRPAWSGRSRARGGWLASAFAIVLCLFIFTGGSLVPGLSRDQYQPANLLQVNSPLHMTAAVFADGQWAQSHLNTNAQVWGDMLVYDVYAGIAGLSMPYNSYDVFTNLSNPGLGYPLGNFTRVHVGDYVVTDVYDTQMTPHFYGAGNHQPNAPLTPAQVTKFQDTRFFSLVFSDPVFTVYVVTTVP